jgi:hypothetical protein
MMGMLGDNKKRVAAILGEMTPKKKDVPLIEGEFSGAKEALAKEIMTAFEDKDPKMLAKSLSHFLALCDKEEDYSGEE